MNDNKIKSILIPLLQICKNFLPPGRFLFLIRDRFFKITISSLKTKNRASKSKRHYGSDTKIKRASDILMFSSAQQGLLIEFPRKR